jgi:hypothetical protein
MGLPAGAIAPFVGTWGMRYSQHAQAAAENDRYGRMELLPRETIAAHNVVEVEVVDGKASKAVVRLAYDADVDIIIVMNRPIAGTAFVKTVWFNSAHDKHGTLKRELISRPTAADFRNDY